MESFEQTGDPEILTRMAQYEMAYRMQRSIPELTDLSHETKATFDLYGEDARQPGTFANHCLMARRLAERDVRFIQLFHRGWDHHSSLPANLSARCQQTDQASAALVTDLKQRGLLEDTLVVWGGEFGRTTYSQGKATAKDYGRDHHPRCFSIWLAGGGIRGGLSYGQTDDFSYNIVKDPVSVTRPACHNAPSTRHQPPRFDLSLPRPAIQTHGRCRQHHPALVGLKPSMAPFPAHDPPPTHWPSPQIRR